MRNNKILFVDDDELIFDIISRKLTKYDLQLYFAKSADEALKLLKDESIAVVITDIRMPGMNGISLLENTQRLFPNVVRMAMSSLKDLKSILIAIENGKVFKYICKPLKFEEELAPAILEAMEEHKHLVEHNRSSLMFDDIDIELIQKKLRKVGVGELSDFLKRQ